MKKYEFTGEVKLHLGRTLHRIRACVSFGIVEKGDEGGWIEKEENLSHDGNAWVYGNAHVYGDEIQHVADVCNITNQIYNITITPKHINIGCQYHSRTAWFKFKDSEIEKMDGEQAVKWWKIWKPILKAICDKDLC